MKQNKKIHDVGSPYQLADKILDFFKSSKINEGVFLEAGASNGIWQSNSYYLEKILGWNGILVEPNKNMFELCVKNRQNPKNHFFNCALVSEEYPFDLIKGYFNEKDFENILMAQVDEVEQSEERNARWFGKQSVFVPAQTLNSIFNQVNKKVDFLSLDVEGYELEALAGSNIETHRPTFVCIEVWEDGDQQEKVIEYFNQRDYKINRYFSQRDILFQDIRGEQ